jgi:hypothetical protein
VTAPCGVCAGETCACDVGFPWSTECQVCRYVRQKETNMTENERARALSDALDVTAQRKYRKNFAECDETQRHDVAGDVLQSRPELAPLSMRVEGPGSVPTRDARDRVAHQYGFSEAQIAADPLKASMVSNATFFAERDEYRASVEEQFAAVGKQLGLNPAVYGDRLKIGAHMARTRHPLAMAEQRFYACF